MNYFIGIEILMNTCYSLFKLDYTMYIDFLITFTYSPSSSVIVLLSFPHMREIYHH